jgi:hypothetical protein
MNKITTVSNKSAFGKQARAFSQGSIVRRVAGGPYFNPSFNQYRIITALGVVSLHSGNLTRHEDIQHSLYELVTDNITIEGGFNG